MEKMIAENFQVLSNGVMIPAVGFGTDCTFIYLSKNPTITLKKYYIDITKNNKYQLKRDMSLGRIVKRGVESGCLLYDTASAYGMSEKILGYALRHNKREDYFVCTKVSNEQQREGNIYNALKRSLKRLNMDYVDLYLLHWPYPDLFVDSWKQMEDIYEKKLARSIGVCNFHEHHLEELEKHAHVMPMVNQIECHPLLSQEKLRLFCNDRGIRIMAYTPTGRMNIKLRENAKLIEIANNKNKSIAQIIVRWHIQHNNIPIINTTKHEHLKENMDVFDFTLTEEEMASIDGLNENYRLRYNPDTCDYTKL